MAKKLVRTTKTFWDAKPDTYKEQYNDSIVFIEDDETSNQIWSNGRYYCGGEGNDTKNTVGATVDDSGNALFLVGVKSRGDEYIQSYTTGFGTAINNDEKRCWIEGIKENTTLIIPNINCETIKVSQIGVRNTNDYPNYGTAGQVLYSNGENVGCSWGDLPTLESATSDKLGGIKVSSVNETSVTINSESTTSGRYYPIELNSDSKAIVNVPWTDERVKTGNTPGVNYYLCGSTSSDSSTGEYLVKKPTVYVGYTDSIVYAGGFNQSSDERLKNFTERIPIDLDKLSEIKKNYFTWKDSENKEQQLGISAQEIRELYPEIVSEQENGTLTVAYDKLSVIALAAIDELHKKNKELEERLTLLENKLK